jgi:hypothetical protein
MKPGQESLLEALLKPGATGTEQEWQQFKECLLSSFAVFLGAEIETVWEPLYEDSSPHGVFAFGFCSSSPLGGPLALAWYGVISNNGHGHVCALVLVFAQDQRMIHHAGKEYLYFEFVPDADGRRQWVNRGWSSSEMNEWDGYTYLAEVCRQKREAQTTQRE